jgi:RNA polymerase sigma factor (sigma-70 family)
MVTRFERLVEEYDAAMRRLARAYTNGGADAEDLVQEILFAVWRALPSFRGESSERTWIYRIAHNVALTRVTRTRRLGKVEAPIAELDHAPDSRVGPESGLIDDERHRMLLNAIQKLDLVNRQILLLHLEGMSYGEIEEVSGFSQTVIATRLTRTRARLAELIRSAEVRS